MSDNIRSVERAMRQSAVYWAVEKYDPDGEPIYEEAIQIKCRWESVNEQFVDGHGKDAFSNAKLFVDRDVTLDGQLWEGELEDLTSQTDPSENPGAYAIRRFDKIPNKKATKFLRIVYL